MSGLALDSVNRNLYFVNLGEVMTVAGVMFRWHKIEVAPLSGGAIRTVVTSAEKPRGLYVDSEQG